MSHNDKKEKIVKSDVKSKTVNIFFTNFISFKLDSNQQPEILLEYLQISCSNLWAIERNVKYGGKIGLQFSLTNGTMLFFA